MAGGGGEIGSKYGNVSGFIFIFNLVVSYAPSPPMLLHLPPLVCAHKKSPTAVLKRWCSRILTAVINPAQVGTGALTLPKAMESAGWLLSVVFLCVSPPSPPHRTAPHTHMFPFGHLRISNLALHASRNWPAT